MVEDGAQAGEERQDGEQDALPEQAGASEQAALPEQAGASEQAALPEQAGASEQAALPEQAGASERAGEAATGASPPVVPRRRRRAASRPAGPPVREPDADQAQLFPTSAPTVSDSGEGPGLVSHASSTQAPDGEAPGAAGAPDPADAGSDQKPPTGESPEGADTEEAAAGEPTTLGEDDLPRTADEGGVTEGTAAEGDESSDDVAEDSAAKDPTDEDSGAAKAGTEDAASEDAAGTEDAASEDAVSEHAAGTEDAAAANSATKVPAPADEVVVNASGAAPKRPRRATRGVTTVAFSAVLEPDTPATVPAADAPAAALFQPPDQTKAVRRSRSARSGASRGAAPASEDESTSATDDTAADQPAESDAESGVRSGRGRRPGGRDEGASEAGTSEAAATEAAASQPQETTETAQGDDQQDRQEQERTADDAPRRRRRRGGRRRRRPTAAGEDDNGTDDNTTDDSGTDGDDAESATESSESAVSTAGGESKPPTNRDDAEDDTDVEDSSESPSARRRRRRRRRAGVAEEMEDLSAEDPPNTVVKVREGRRPKDEITSVRGSTRIEAKKQRRRDGREAGRRRPPILTEAEFLARREAVSRVMCVREHGDRTQIAVLEDGILVEHYVNRAESSSMVGNVYLGKVQNVLPSMEAAFVDIGRGRNAVLYAGEVNWDAAGMEGQPKRIELAMKSGDPVLVQVTKDPIGHKGARLTSQISLPGRFLVYVPEGSMTGISRKLPDIERSRLKGILKDVVPDEAGVIVRTAAEGASEEQLTADVTRLAAQWKDIRKKAKSASPPSLLYGEPDLAIKVVRDIFNEDFTELLVQGPATWDTLSEYIGWLAADLLPKVTQWVENDDLYAAHRIDEQLAKALDRKVWLPSGGSLVIDRTEAMTVIDVNTGKFTGQGGNLEETVTSNNLEAAEEIVRQLRLRDIGGIIVVDFIDMVLESNRDLVLRRLVECLGRDRTKHQVAEVTSLGLVQMTRKRIGQGLLEVFSTPCEHCGGRGHLVSAEPVASEQVDDTDNRRDRGNRRGRKKAAPALGGKQTGRTPPPPKFDHEGHPHHDDEGHPHHDDEGQPHHDDEGQPHHDYEGQPHHDDEGQPHHDEQPVLAPSGVTDPDADPDAEPDSPPAGDPVEAADPEPETGEWVHDAAGESGENPSDQDPDDRTDQRQPEQDAV